MRQIIDRIKLAIIRSFNDPSALISIINSKVDLPMCSGHISKGTIVPYARDCPLSVVGIAPSFYLYRTNTRTGGAHITAQINPKGIDVLPLRPLANSLGIKYRDSVECCIDDFKKLYAHLPLGERTDLGSHCYSTSAHHQFLIDDGMGGAQTSYLKTIEFKKLNYGVEVYANTISEHKVPLKYYSQDDVAVMQVNVGLACLDVLVQAVERDTTRKVYRVEKMTSEQMIEYFEESVSNTLGWYVLSDYLDAISISDTSVSSFVDSDKDTFADGKTFVCVSAAKGAAIYIIDDTVDLEIPL